MKTRNFSRQIVNSAVSKTFSDEAVPFPSTDKVKFHENGEDDSQYPVEILIPFTAGSTLTDHELTLKVGFPVILSCSVGHIRFHVSGVRYIVNTVHTNIPMLK